MFEKIITYIHSMFYYMSEFFNLAREEFSFGYGLLKSIFFHSVRPTRNFNHEFPKEMATLNKFLGDICKKEKIKQIPQIEICNFFEPACAFSFFSFIPSVIYIPKEEFELQKDLKCAKATILHELSHIKHEDSFFSFIIFSFLYFTFLYCLFKSIPLGLASLLVCTKLFQFYSHRIEYRADALVKKYNLEFHLIKQLAWFELQEGPMGDSLSHPSLMKRNKKLNPHNHHSILKKVSPKQN